MKKRKLIITALIVFLVQGLSWGLWISQAGMKIKLIDKDTKQPIAGAMVLNYYEVGIFPAGSNDYGTKLFRTSESGEVYIPRFFKMTWPWVGFVEQSLTINATGYVLVDVDIGPYNVKTSTQGLEWVYGKYRANLNYEYLGEENGKHLYRYKKYKEFSKIVDKEKKLIISSKDGEIYKVELETPLKYLEIPMSKISSEKKYLEVLNRSLLPWSLCGKKSEMSKHHQRMYDEIHRFLIENRKEFLRQYPESKERFNKLRGIADIYTQDLKDTENGFNYYKKLIEEGNEYLNKNPQKSRERESVIWTLAWVSYYDLKDYELALLYFQMAKEEASTEINYTNTEKYIRELQRLIEKQRKY